MELNIFREGKLAYLFVNTSKFTFKKCNSSRTLCPRAVCTSCRFSKCFDDFSKNPVQSINSTFNKQISNKLYSNYSYRFTIKPYSSSTKHEPQKNDTVTDTDGNKNVDNVQSTEKLSVFKRMKQLTKDYWHILIPVHLVTSIGWMAAFYFAAKNGVDIIGILKSLHLSEKYLEMLRGSSAGHWAVAYALYKIFTPLRYTVTVGGTTLAIRYLNRLGILKFKRIKKD